MAYNYEYPYTDPNRHNDDWILNKMKEVEKGFRELEEKWKDGFKDILKEFFNEIMPTVVYDEAKERITLSFENVVGDGVHYYDANSDTMVIEDKKEV